MGKDYIDTLLSNVHDYYQFFREKIKTYGFYGFLNNFNIEYMHEWFLKNNPQHEYKMFVCLTENNTFNEFVSYLSDHQDLLSFFIENSDIYYSIFGYCDDNSFRIIFDAYK